MMQTGRTILWPVFFINRSICGGGLDIIAKFLPGIDTEIISFSGVDKRKWIMYNKNDA